MLVTLDIYSGQENPFWELSANQANELISRLAGKAVAPLDAGEGKLGLRGYIISASSDDSVTDAGLPDTFRLAAGAVEEFLPSQETELPPLSAPDTSEAALWLLTTSSGAVDDDLLNTVKDMISSQGKPVEEAPAEAEAVAPCIIRNTPYNPGFWNRPGVQPYNNCYNYAMNYRSNTFAQPGRISGHPNNVMQCPNVATAANYDGCKATCSGPNKNVALVIWPGRDYHWYRYHSNGFWGHKPGSTAARNTDNRGRVIGGHLNPQNCDRGPYTVFCGYRFSPVGMKVK
jgi:hypothetical protein